MTEMHVPEWSSARRPSYDEPKTKINLKTHQQNARNEFPPKLDVRAAGVFQSGLDVAYFPFYKMEYIWLRFGSRTLRNLDGKQQTDTVTFNKSSLSSSVHQMSHFCTTAGRGRLHTSGKQPHSASGGGLQFQSCLRW